MKTTQELLIQLTKANKEYKLKLAVKAGFSSVEDYKNFLKNEKVIQKLNRRQLSRLFVATQDLDRKTKVSYQKKLKVDDVYKTIFDTLYNTTPITLPKVMKNVISKAIEGEERVMNYRFHGKYDSNGLAYVTDLDQPENDNLRVINLDRINWIELDNVKYTL